MEMDDIVGHFVPELRKKFKGKILGVYLSGSIDKETATPESDIDILVVYSDNMVCYVDLDGRIQPCCDFAGRNTNKYFGNVFEDSFMNVYNNPKLMNFRRKIRKGCREEYICKRCVPLTLREMIGSGNKFPSKFLRRQQK